MKEEFGQLMGETSRLWKMALNERLKPIGISHAKFVTLYLLSKQEGIAQNKLAKLLSVENPTLARVLSSLEKDGFIKRVKCSSDKRIKLVYFTKNGHKKLEDSKAVLEILRDEMLFGVSDEKLRVNIETLKVLVENLTNR